MSNRMNAGNRKKSRIRQCGSLLLCGILCIIFLAVPARAAGSEADREAAEKTSTDKAHSEVVKVGWYEDSYHITGKNGNRSGYGYEYEQAVSAYTGWDYDYVTGNWEELLKKLQDGEIDLMSSLSYTDERAKTMLFSDLPMGEEKYYLYADLANSDISASDISSLNGQSIAMMENSVQTTQFYDWEKKYNVKTKHVFVNSMDQAMEMFGKHEIQGVISTETSIWVNTGLSAVFTTGGSEIYYGINKNRPDLKEELGSAMRAMENDKPFYSDDLYKQYIATQSVAVLSSDEQEWLKQHGAIRVGYLENDPGFSAVDPHSGKLMGVVNDYVEYASNCFEQPLEFDLVGLDSQEALIQAVRDDKIDMIFHVDQNPYYAEKNGLSLSNTVLSLPFAAVTAQEAFNESAENTVAIAKENSKYKWYVTYNYPDWNIKEYNSIKDAEQAICNGNADCFIARSGQAMDYVNDKKMHSVFLTKTANTLFAVDKGNTILMSILNKTLKSIQTSKLTGAVTMYEDSLKKVTFSDFVKDNFLQVIIMFSLVFILILGMFIHLLKKAKAAERKARESKIQAEKANAAKSAFLFNMSHDIRTPMNAIVGFTDIAMKRKPDKEVENCLKKIRQSSEYLMTLINDVLDISRIESGKLEYKPVPVDLRDMTDTVLSIARGYTENRDLNFYVSREELKNPYVMADELRIREVLLNIISNAVKFTKDGGTISFAAENCPGNDEHHTIVRYRISDTGIGMSEEFQARIFDEFSQENGGARTSYKGTGLGMAIAKQYVDLMGGKIEVSSRKGIGSTFTVEIPLLIAEQILIEKEETLRKDMDLHGLHVLLAEDNDLDAEIAVALLEEQGMIVTRTVDGKSALAQFCNTAPGTFDLILMDIMMPEMNGYETTTAIRNLPDRPDGKKIPIIAMMANAFAEDVQAALNAGMDDHVAKPIDMSILISVITKYIER